MDSTRTLRAFRAPPLGLLATEPLRALLDHFAARVATPAKPIGDGHSVIVYPGLAGGAITTLHLRRFLNTSGFEAQDWQGGINTGPQGEFDEWLAVHAQRVREMHERDGQKVSLVGWSLGGVYAREIAKMQPQAVRSVITMGTPFQSLGGGNHAGTVYKWLNGDATQLTPEMQERLRERPPVPTTSIFSRNDGIVSWRGCIERRTEISESVEVDASHLGMGSHPQVLRIVADRLAQREGEWRPMRRVG